MAAGPGEEHALEAADEVAEHLLVWLRERGFRVVPIDFDTAMVQTPDRA